MHSCYKLCLLHHSNPCYVSRSGMKARICILYEPPGCDNEHRRKGIKSLFSLLPLAPAGSCVEVQTVGHYAMKHHMTCHLKTGSTAPPALPKSMQVWACESWLSVKSFENSQKAASLGGSDPTFCFSWPWALLPQYWVSFSIPPGPLPSSLSSLSSACLPSRPSPFCRCPRPPGLSSSHQV